MQIKFLLLLLFTSFAAKVIGANSCISFYSEEICVDYSKKLIVKEGISLSDEYFNLFFDNAETNGGNELYNELNSICKSRKLNDWLFYELISSFAKKINKDSNKQTLLVWYLLSKHGFKTQLIYSRKEVFIKIYSDFSSPDLLKNDIDETYKWIYLGSEVRKRYPKAYISKVKKNSEEYEVFSLDFTEVPSLKDMRIEQKKIRFSNSGKEYNLTISFNKTYLEILDNMPRPVDSAFQFFIPISETFRESLGNGLISYTNSLSDEEKIRFYLSISRTAKEYKRDIDAYGVTEKPLSFEEALYYAYNDCEDKSAILAGLIKLYMDTPYVVLNYPSDGSLNSEGHINIAISIPYNEEGADFIVHKEKKYILLEPSDNNDNSGIGYGGKSFDKVPYKIIYQFEPQN